MSEQSGGTPPITAHSTEMTLNMGPSHPTTHGIVRLKVRTQGEEITDCDIEIGYLHRGFEKMCENHPWNQCVVYVDRLNYVSPIINDVGYHMAVEKLLDIEVPVRGQWLRMLTSELMRICDHQTCIAASCMELGAFTAFLYLIKGRDLIWEVLEKICGARVTTSYTRIGGLAYEPYPGMKEEILELFTDLRDINREIDQLMSDNRIFIDRTRGVGALDRATCLSYGFTGPVARAAGIEYDVRVQHPYLLYNQVDFDIPVCSGGDCYDRYLVRLHEMEQSLRIVEQSLAKLPADGPVSVPDARYTAPPKEQVYTRIEGLMNHFKHHMWGHMLTPPPGAVYHAVEGGNGELGFYLVSTGGEQPWKVRCRPPCFGITQALKEMIIGRSIADVVPIFGSINMIGGELDR
ncbi:MAG: NADH-quinone oxidoreductase subunit D [Candidatus Delongbacteria bacterium]